MRSRAIIWAGMMVLGMLHSRAESKVASYQAIGNLCFHSTNLDSNNYRTFNGWMENRILLEKLQLGLWGANSTLFFSLTGTLGKERIPHEHKFVAGIGVQNYLFKHLVPDLADRIRWLEFCRFFIDYSAIHYYFGTPTRPFPPANFRAGYDLWFEHNVPDVTYSSMAYSGFWYDLWMQCVYQSTNFKEGYRTWTFSSLAHAGFFLAQKNSKSAFYFHMTAGLSASGKSYFWENRVVGGFGVRFFPLKNSDSGLNRIQIYGELLHALYYFKDPPEKLYRWDYTKSSIPVRVPADDRPNWDLQFGLSFSLGKWWNYSL